MTTIVQSIHHHKRRIKAVLLVMPLLVSLFVFFLAPIAYILYKSFYNPVVSELLPKTLSSLENWNYDGSGLPEDKTYKIFALELKILSEVRLSGKLAEQINHILPHSGAVIKRTARALKTLQFSKQEDFKKLLGNLDAIWLSPDIWAGIKNSGSVFTLNYYANALDYNVGLAGDFIKRPGSSRVYIPILTKTLWIALLITLICFAFGYPVAYYIASVHGHHANILLMLVLLPFWTSFLVRTTAWIAILQTDGIVNKTLLYFNLISKPLDILYNQFATILAMVHILMPFMILPLYSVMKGIDKSYLHASKSLGANSIRSFIYIYFPLSLPGVMAGALLVFVISLGYYITPALLGGIDGQLMSNLVVLHMRETNNWQLGAALSTILLILVLVLYVIYDKWIGFDKLKF